MNGVSKKSIQDFWTENVPGLDLFSKKYSPLEKGFYLEADAYRIKYEPSVVPLIESFAAPGKLVLEIGCGLGSDSRQMAKKGASVVSLDLSFRNVYFTGTGMRLLGLCGEGVCSDAENLPFRDNVFDAVYSFGVLHHTPDTAKAVREVLRVLKPGGEARIMLYHKGYAYYFLLLRHGWKFIFSRQRSKLTNEYDHTPLSKMYSKRGVRKLFSAFREINLKMTTFGGIQNHRLLKWVWVLFNKADFLMNNFGSFLIIEAKK